MKKLIIFFVILLGLLLWLTPVLTQSNPGVPASPVGPPFPDDDDGGPPGPPFDPPGPPFDPPGPPPGINVGADIVNTIQNILNAEDGSDAREPEFVTLANAVAASAAPELGQAILGTNLNERARNMRQAAAKLANAGLISAETRAAIDTASITPEVASPETIALIILDVANLQDSVDKTSARYLDLVDKLAANFAGSDGVLSVPELERYYSSLAPAGN